MEDYPLTAATEYDERTLLINIRHSRGRRDDEKDRNEQVQGKEGGGWGEFFSFLLQTIHIDYKGIHAGHQQQSWVIAHKLLDRQFFYTHLQTHIY